MPRNCKQIVEKFPDCGKVGKGSRRELNAKTITAKDPSSVEELLISVYVIELISAFTRFRINGPRGNRRGCKTQSRSS
jgi:hypothetical protein